MNFKPATRKKIYAIATAVIPVLTILGYVSDELAGQILNAVAAILAIGTGSLAFKDRKSVV